LANKKKQKDSAKRAKKQFRGKESSENLKSCITDIVKFCKDNDIDIIAIKFPLAKDYLIEVDGRNFGADMYFANLGIKTYDLTEIYIDHDEYFANQDHLNDIGGELFSKELLKIVQTE